MCVDMEVNLANYFIFILVRWEYIDVRSIRIKSLTYIAIISWELAQQINGYVIWTGVQLNANSREKNERVSLALNKICLFHPTAILFYFLVYIILLFPHHFSFVSATSPKLNSKKEKKKGEKNVKKLLTKRKRYG